MAEGPILILGNGGWGTALSIALAEGGRELRIWGHDADYARQVEERRENLKFLPGCRLPEGIRVGADIGALAPGVDAVFSVVPTQFLRRALEELSRHLPPTALYVSCSKGFERQSLALPSQVLRAVIPRARTAVLSGPSHAEEVARGLPAAVVAASEGEPVALETQRLLNGPRLRVYTSTDALGVEVAGAMKNVIALAAGISDGLGFGDNARAALLTRGLREMTRLGQAMGARAETFAGLAGMGDLIATCTSHHSRNHAVGLRIARGETLDAIVRSTEKVAEGIETARSLVGVSVKLGIPLPITTEVHAVLFLGRSPRQAVEALMSRETKDELG